MENSDEIKLFANPELAQQFANEAQNFVNRAFIRYKVALDEEDPLVAE